MTERGTLEVLVEEATWFLRIALENVESPAAFVHWVQRLGWTFGLPVAQSLNDTVIALESAIDSTLRINFDKPIEDQLDVVQDLALSFFDALSEARTLPGAIAELDGGPPEINIEKLAEDAGHDLVAEYIERRFPATHALCVLLGIIEIEATRLRKIRPERIGTLFTAPESVAALYDWDSTTSGFNYSLFTSRLSDLASAVGLPARSQATPAAFDEVLGPVSGSTLKSIRVPVYELSDPNLGLVEVALHLSPAIDGSTVVGFGLLPEARGAAELVIDLPGSLSLTLGGSLGGALAVVFQPGSVDVVPLLSEPAEFSARLSFGNPNARTILFGSPNATRFEVAGMALGLRGGIGRQGEPEFASEFAVDLARIVVAPGEGDGFLQKILPPEGFAASFGLTIGWSTQVGFYFDGSVGFEVTIPIQEEFGPIVLESVYIASNLAPGANATELTFEAAVTAGAEIGPIVASVEELGLRLILTLDGDFSASDLSFGFKPPKGVGLGLDAGPIVGGGYLDIGDHEYSGMLDLRFGEIRLTAIGLINTRLPGGDGSGYSMLGIVNVIFDPCVTVGFGFFWCGIGGYLGIHRSIITEEVQKSVDDGSIDSLLFPPDPIANAPKIISDLKRIFPPQRDRHLFGVAVRMVYSQPALVVLDLALLLEIPEPIKIAIFGRISAVLPDEEAELIVLKFFLAGILDTEKKLLSIDAGLYDSHVIGLVITGSMALRARWGDDPMFIMAAGGFDPSFEVPAGFPTLTPLGVRLGTATSNPRLSLGGYFAVTSNTVQFGARLDVYFRVSEFSVEGFLEFNALFEFSPFYFRARMLGAFSVKQGNSRLLGVDVDLLLKGPKPWYAKGTGKFQILFFDVSVSFEVTIGEPSPQIYPPMDPFCRVVEQLQDDNNWVAPGDRRRAAVEVDGAQLILGLDDHIEVREKVLPLEIEVQKVGNNPTPHPMVFSLSRTGEDIAVEKARDHFALGQYQKQSNSQRLGSKSYEKLVNGIRLSPPDTATTPRSVRVPLEYETRTLKNGKSVSATPERPASLELAHLLTASLGSGRYHQTAASLNVAKTCPVAQKESGFVAVDTSTGTPISDVHQVQAEVEAGQLHASAQTTAIFLTSELNSGA